MRIRVLLTCLVIAATAAACGKSPEQQQAEDAQKAAAAVGRGLSDMAKAMTNAAGGADANQKPVEPVSFHDLEAAFNELPGWQMGKPTGERNSVPVNFSEAKVTYKKGDAEIEVEISDSAFNQMLMVPYTMFLTAGYEKQTEHGYEKSTKVGDNPGYEKWDGQDKSGELNVIVNKRFIVQLSGSNLPDANALHTAIGSVDLKRLAGLK
jgi:hypothetical protein